MATILERSEMASIQCDPDGSWRCQFYFPNGLRKKIYLGKIKRANAQFFRSKIEGLIVAARVGNLDSDPQWVSRLSPRIVEQLASCGLIIARAVPTDLRFRAMATAYLESRTDIKQRTKDRLQSAADRFSEEYGSRHIASITEGDAGRFAAWLRANTAHSTAGRELKRLRQFFTAFMGDNLIRSNPFASVDVSQNPDKARESYITTKATEEILEKIGCIEIKAVVALARYCGLRVPSEPLALEWSHIDWELGRLTIKSPKLEGKANAIRQCPIFPEVRKHLDTLWEAPLSDRYVFSRYRSSAGTHYRNHLLAAIEKAGRQPWEKLFQNLRASCRTDLEKRFPNHVCNEWLGHSGKVAEKHYLTITEEDWTNAREHQGAPKPPSSNKATTQR